MLVEGALLKILKEMLPCSTAVTVTGVLYAGSEERGYVWSDVLPSKSQRKVNPLSSILINDPSSRP